MSYLKIRKVILGISGGVDSAVAALLLKKKGLNVEAVFMKNWDIKDETGVCTADEDYKDACFICDKLNIKIHSVNFVKEYWNEVFSSLISEYENGNTPNPDILCNKNIKFNHFFNYVTNRLGADAVATGHYARTSFGPFLENYRPDKDVTLLKAIDSVKDQTFFLCQINQEALRKTMFPLGSLIKREVKQIAFENGLEKIAFKKESMGICFIGSRNFQDFIKEYIPDKIGKFVDIDTGEEVGTHNGVHQWTLGQRSRVHSLKEALYIARKNLEDNTIYVAHGTNHPILFSSLFFTSKPHWISGQPDDLKVDNVLECSFKFQHTKPWVPCQVCESKSGLAIKLEQPIRAITPGQYAIVSKGDEILGSARIINSGVSEFSFNYLQNKAEELHNLQNIIKRDKIRINQKT